VVVAAVGVPHLIAQHTQSELVEEKSVTANVLVERFAASAAAPLVANSAADLRAEFERLRRDDQVTYAALWRSGAREPVLASGVLPVSDQPPAVGTRELDDTLELTRAVTDASGRSLGSVVVGFTLHPEIKSAQSTRARLLFVSGLLAVGASIAVFATSRRRLRRKVAAAVAARTSMWPRNTDTPGSGPKSGDVLGQYQLLTCVGQGGMGRVWAARRVGSPIQRLVALKTGLDASKQTAEFRALFTDEARIASLIRHPNVCGVYEFGQHEDMLYQAMEWCDGASLRQLLDQLPEKRLDIPVAVRIIANVAAGLHAAHQLEDDDGVALHVVHRDVSPQNILISKRGQVQVTDFGVAKARGQLHRPASRGEIKGKVSYIAPEQVTSKEVDHRTDIFSLGCVLYEATVGYGPFRGKGSLSTMYQLLAQQGVPSPRDEIPGYPVELERLLEKALARDPNERFQTAEEFGIALEEWLTRAHGIVTEQNIAELMSSTADEFIKEKARRIEQAMSKFAPPVPIGLDLLPAHVRIESAVRSANGTSRNAPLPVSAASPVSAPLPVAAAAIAPETAEAAARPTIPVGRRTRGG
jgi:serine/threonine-protein kinase